MKLKISQAVTLRNGLAALDGYDKIIGKGDGEKTARQLYKLGAIRLDIAKNINRLNEACEAFTKARQELVFEMADGKGKVPDEKMREFVTQEQKMLDTEQEIDIISIKVEDLKVGDGPDQNPIPGTVLALLEPALISAESA